MVKVRGEIDKLWQKFGSYLKSIETEQTNIKVVYMRVLAASDFHQEEELIESIVSEANSGKYDLFIAPGDFVSEESYRDIEERIEIPMIAATGNWDFNFTPPSNDDFQFLHNYMKIDFQEDYKIPVIGSVFPDDYQKDISEWVGDHDPKKLFFITHYPPKRLGDKAVTGVRAGIEGFRKMIMKLKPAAWFCGHIHEAFGHYKFMKTDVFNCSVVDSRKCFSVEFGEEGVEDYEEVDLS